MEKLKAKAQTLMLRLGKERRGKKGDLRRERERSE